MRMYTGCILNSAAIIRRLERDGWRHAGGRGSHRNFTHPTKPGRVTVPHPRKDLYVRTLRNIYRQAGWDWRDR